MISFAGFKKEVWAHYWAHTRAMPWRTNHSPYFVVVSELMLQQTQVPRVLVLFPKFIKKFPSFAVLARAPRARVLRAWQGLGYNRRALYLHEIARKIAREYGGVLPRDTEALKIFPGIGHNTAGSICAFAFNMPVVFVETNIRTVFLHHFFKNKNVVSDADILRLVKKTLDVKNPREWYWALMDYGAYIKRTYGNPNARSKHYVKQSKFEGSNRQLRGKILKILLAHPRGITQKKLILELGADRQKLQKPLSQLLREDMIIYKKGRYSIA